MSEWSPTQTVLVDDTDPRIIYEGSGWVLDTSGSTNSWGVFGPTLKNTLHQAKSDSSFSFTFTGTEIEVLGTVRTRDNLPSPSWICTIDGKSTGRLDVPPDQHSNHWSMCLQTLENAGPHLLTFNVTVPDTAIFYLDMVSFAANSTVSRNETIRIQDNDPSVTYGGLWNATNDISHDTDARGAFVTLKFNGTSVTPLALLPPNLTDSTATWAIDGGQNHTFTLPGHEGTDNDFNFPIFTAGNLSTEEHTLVITYTGEKGATPLSVDTFYVDLPSSDGSEVPSNVPSLSSSPSETDTPSSTPSASRKSSNAGAIAGGVVGGVIGLALILMLVWVLLRRRRYRQDMVRKGLEPEPFIARKRRVASNEKGSPSSPGPNSDSAHLVSPAASSQGDVERSSSAISKQHQALSAASSSATQPVDVQHTDSGVRLGEPSGSGGGNTLIRDIPPQYTEH